MHLRHVFLLAIQLALSSGAIYSGVTKDDAGSMVFLGKFVFDVAEPNMDPELLPKFEVRLTLTDPSKRTDPAYQTWEVLLFDDEETSWAKVYGQDLQCKDASTFAKNYGFQPVVQFNDHGQFEYTGRISQLLRPRYWFIVLANCNGDGIPVGVEYEAHLTNTARNGWSVELGFNFIGINTMYLLVSLAFIPFICLHFHGVITLRKKLQFTHPLIKMFTGILLVQLFAILCYLSYWSAYTHNGKGLAGAKPMGEIGDIIARVAFMLLLILLAKGWTISGEELTQKRLILGSVGGFGLVFVLILILKDAVADEAATNYPIYIRVFIFFLLAAWFGFAVWFAMCIRRSYSLEDNPVKKALYRNLGLVFTPWFFGYPLVYIVSMLAAEYRKDIIVETFAILISFFGYAILSYMLWPSRAEEFFNISTPDVQKSNVDTYEQL